MITKEQIKMGIDQGIIKFIVDPNLNQGTVCAIGDGWFYFGGSTAEEENPEIFLKNAEMDEVVLSIQQALESLSLDSNSEHLYYEAFLQEHLQLKGDDKMKPTGIVRHIDDLGRIMIPKDIRRTLRIHEMDAFEITVSEETGEIILKKHGVSRKQKKDLFNLLSLIIENFAVYDNRKEVLIEKDSYIQRPIKVCDIYDKNENLCGYIAVDKNCPQEKIDLAQNIFLCIIQED